MKCPDCGSNLTIQYSKDFVYDIADNGEVILNDEVVDEYIVSLQCEECGVEWYGEEFQTKRVEGKEFVTWLGE